MSYADWLGRQESSDCVLQLQQANFMAASLGQDRTFNPGDPLPHGWHWLYFLQAAPRDQLGRDGHPKRGGFLPPVDLPRRMWAGGRLQFHSDLPLGALCRKTSTITSIKEKESRQGPLCLVTVTHEISVAESVALVEEHDIVYLRDREPHDPIADGEPPATMQFSESFSSDSTLLFRYSALTFNGHKIHYDLDYCRDIEGYPGLLFHGPLTATLLLDLASRKLGHHNVQSFDFRAMAPIFHDEVILFEGRRDANALELQAVNARGGVSMRARVNNAV
jgi:3-methylfumaryl-CoA hydratase